MATLWCGVALLVAYASLADIRTTEEAMQNSTIQAESSLQPHDAVWAGNGSWRGRRLRRDAATDLAVGGLNILGVVVSFAGPFGPIAGAMFSILGSLLPLLFPGGGDPTTAFGELIREERAKQQKSELLGFKDTMWQIRKQSNTGDVESAKRRMLSLYDTLNSARYKFMHTDNVRSSFTYFREFAILHLVVNQAIIVINSTGAAYWQEILDKNVREYVSYANFVVQKEAESGRNVRRSMDPWIEKWTKQLPTFRQATLRNLGVVRNGGAVSLKIGRDNEVAQVYLSNHWLSCKGSGSRCAPRSCSGEDSPMDRGSQYECHWRCRGEVFFIYLIDDNADGIIRTCSRVGINYSYMKGKHWWLSNSNIFHVTDTKSCPGSSTSSMRNGACGCEAWRIYVLGQPCGVPVKDRDLVRLINECKGRSPLASYMIYSGCNHRFSSHFYYWDAIPEGDDKLACSYFINFIIFRSDVDHGEHSRNLP